MTDKIDSALRHLGVDPAELPDGVLDALRAATPAPTDPLEAAYAEAVLTPPDPAERERAARAFARDVADALADGRDTADRPDLQPKDTL